MGEESFTLHVLNHKQKLKHLNVLGGNKGDPLQIEQFLSEMSNGGDQQNGQAVSVRHQDYQIQFELQDDSSPYFLSKYIPLVCNHCKTEVGKLLLSTPTSLSPLLEQAVIDTSLVSVFQPCFVHSVTQERLDFDKLMAKVKDLEDHAEKQFYHRFELLNLKFGEALDSNKMLLSQILYSGHMWPTKA